MKKVCNASVAAIRAGARSKDIFDIANEIIKKELKQNMVHSLGHGLGIDVHDYPDGMSEKSKWRLEEGMVLTVEPGYYGNRFGIRIEDDVAVSKNSPKLLSKFPKEIVEI